MIRHIRASAMVAACLACSLSWTAAAFPHESLAPHRALWLYRFMSDDATTIVRTLQTLNMTLVYLSTDGRKLPPLGPQIDQDYTARVRTFLRLAHAADIEVHAMILQQPEYTHRANHPRAVERVKHIIAFTRQSPESERFDGIHLDTEPHALPEWKHGKRMKDWETVENLMSSYMALLATVRRTLGNSSPLPLSAAIHWKYNELAEAGHVPSGSAARLARFLDTLVLMVFATNDVSTLLERSRNDVLTAPTIVGIRAEDFVTYRALISALARIDDQYRSAQYYRGTSVFHFSTLAGKYQQIVP